MSNETDFREVVIARARNDQALLASNIGVAENDLLFPLRMHCRLLPEILSEFPTVSAALQNSKSAEAIQCYLESGDQ